MHTCSFHRHLCEAKGGLFSARGKGSSAFINAHSGVVFGRVYHSRLTEIVLKPTAFCIHTIGAPFREGPYGLLDTLLRVGNQVTQRGDPQLDHSFRFVLPNLPLDLVPRAAIQGAKIGTLARPRAEVWFHVPAHPRNRLLGSVRPYPVGIRTGDPKPQS